MRRKIYLILLIIFCLFISLGLKIYIRNNVTVEWDATSYTGDGVVTYEVYLFDVGAESSTFLGETAELEYTFDIPSGAEQIPFIRTKVVDDEGEHFSAVLMASDESNPVPFGLLQVVPAPKDIRIK